MRLTRIQMDRADRRKLPVPPQYVAACREIPSEFIVNEKEAEKRMREALGLMDPNAKVFSPLFLSSFLFLPPFFSSFLRFWVKLLTNTQDTSAFDKEFGDFSFGGTERNPEELIKKAPPPTAKPAAKK